MTPTFRKSGPRPWNSLADRDYADDGSGALKPMLAESWTISPDKLKYRIKLRRGVLWHDFRDPVTGKGMEKQGSDRA